MEIITSLPEGHGFCQVLSLLLLSYLIPRPSPPKVLLGPLVDRTHNDTHALCSITDGQVVFALVASRQTRNRQQLRELDEKLQQTSCVRLLSLLALSNVRCIS